PASPTTLGRLLVSCAHRARRRPRSRPDVLCRRGPDARGPAAHGTEKPCESDRPPGRPAIVKSTVETLSPTRVRLTVEVPFEELKPSLDETYREIAKQITIP